MWKSFASAASLLMAASAPAGAQQQQPAAKPESAEAKAAMERAQRMAENPLRVILQAGKIKRRPEDGAPEPVADPAVRRTAVRTGNEPAAPAPVRTAPAVASTSAPTVAAGSQAAAPAPAPVQSAPAPAPEPPPSKVMTSTTLATTSAGSEVPAIEVAQPLEATPVTTKTVAPQAIPLAPANVRPTLVTMVEPEIPTRLQNEAGRVNEVMADLTLREDGTVSAVALASPAPRSWHRYITAALEKWRFEPLPSARVHRVQLVFGE